MKRLALLVSLAIAPSVLAAHHTHHKRPKKPAPSSAPAAAKPIAPAPITPAPTAPAPAPAAKPIATPAAPDDSGPLAPRATATATAPRAATAPRPAAAAATATAPAPDLQLKHADLPAGATRCILCHTTRSWDDVRFAHERTGFPLRGQHNKVSCKSCHPSGFATAVPDRCSGCHRDVHAQEFGLACEGCHDEETWRTTFNADAHRRTNFPLAGRHALIPCEECHPSMRDRQFSRGVVECIGCHQADYARTAGTAVDHMALQFSTSCQQCHTPFRFKPARFADHDRCFTITRGPHGGLSCTQCHTSLTSATITGQCMTNTADCVNCHEHTCARSDARHVNVPGYQCKPRKCYECHRF